MKKKFLILICFIIVLFGLTVSSFAITAESFKITPIKYSQGDKIKTDKGVVTLREGKKLKLYAITYFGNEGMFRNKTWLVC